MNWRPFVSLVCVALQACALRAVPSAPTATPPPPDVPPASGSLTSDQVRNMEVRLVASDAHPTVQLQNGEYKHGGDPGSTEYADVRLLAEPMAFGDINGDGQGDAAALLAENYGGTGVFVSVLAVLNNGGKPVQAGASIIDDRAKVNLLSVQQGLILLAGNIHGSEDPGCCAAMAVSQAYALTPGGLILKKESSAAPDGTQRVITIQAPAPESEITPGPIKVQGTFTVKPFENGLTYRVFDDMQNTLAAGTIPASDGIFDDWVDLTSVPAVGHVRLEIVDLSTASGGPLAVDSVDLMIK